MQCGWTKNGGCVVETVASIQLIFPFMFMMRIFFDVDILLDPLWIHRCTASPMPRPDTMCLGRLRGVVVSFTVALSLGGLVGGWAPPQPPKPFPGAATGPDFITGRRIAEERPARGAGCAVMRSVGVGCGLQGNAVQVWFETATATKCHCALFSLCIFVLLCCTRRTSVLEGQQHAWGHVAQNSEALRPRPGPILGIAAI